MWRNLRAPIIVSSAVMIALTSAHFAVGAVKEDALKLKDQIDARQDHIDEIKQQADRYRAQIKAKESEQATLSNEVGILENRAAATELDIAALTSEIEGTLAEIKLLDGEIDDKSQSIAKKKQLVAELIRSIHAADQVSPLEVLLNNDSFSEFFDRIERLQNVEEETHDAVLALKGLREDMIDRKTRVDGKRVVLDTERTNLQVLKGKLESAQISKNQLMQESAMSEQKFQALLYDVRQEESASESQVRNLQSKLKDVLDRNDDRPGSGTLVSWPISSRLITTYFHDPTYPFRRLFEHSGLDIATPKGTPIKAAAPGYIATATIGRLYGNYITVVHSGGISTVYAHLSRMVVKPDTFVERGQVIGYSGGVPGDYGAGMSTGAHLHFEVRSNGIPTNPLSYLIETE